MPLVYSDQWAIVTGASSGIGEEFAWELARRGMHLVLSARNGAALEQLAAALHTKHATRTLIVAGDLSTPGGVNHLVERVAAERIVPMLLVNNAGFGWVGTLDATSPQTMQSMVDLNISAVMNLTYFYLPRMMERGSGGIINVASVVAFQPVPFMAVYSASKAFVLHFTEALWAEARERGVTVMALCPGTTRTRFFETAGVQSWLKRSSAQTPDEVVATAMRGIERRDPSIVSGWGNYFRSLLPRLARRKRVIMEAARYFRTAAQNAMHPPANPVPPTPPVAPTAESTPTSTST